MKQNIYCKHIVLALFLIATIEVKGGYGDTTESYLSLLSVIVRPKDNEKTSSAASSRQQTTKKTYTISTYAKQILFKECVYKICDNTTVPYLHSVLPEHSINSRQVSEVIGSALYCGYNQKHADIQLIAIQAGKTVLRETIIANMVKVCDHTGVTDALCSAYKHSDTAKWLNEQSQDQDRQEVIAIIVATVKATGRLLIDRALELAWSHTVDR